jgi:hypothetical protein
MPRPAKRQLSRLSGRQSSPSAALAHLQALTAFRVVGRALLPLRTFLGATFVDASMQRIAGLLGSTGAKCPCVY